MGTDSGLVDLIATKEPETTARRESVVMTAPVVVAGTPGAPGQVRLTLTIRQTEYLAAQLDPALRLARAYERQRN